MSKTELPPIFFLTGVDIKTVEEFYGTILDHAARIIASGEEVAPILITWSSDRKLAVMPALKTKDLTAAYQRNIVKSPLTRASAFVVEAWQSWHREDSPRPFPLPADDPKRTEVLMVSIITRGRQAMTFSPINRPANTVERAPFRWLDEAEGKYAGRFVR